MDKKVQQLPPIPEKRYFSIGETSKLCAVKPHVLRYWEQEFSDLKPTTRTGGRRYYQVKDVLLVRQIRELLYEQGFTIAGAKQQLKSVKKAGALATNQTVVTQTIVKPAISDESKQSSLASLIQELELALEQITG